MTQEEAEDAPVATALELSRQPDRYPSLVGLSIPMLRDVQTLHDSCRAWDGNKFIGWKQMRKIAELHRLSDSKIPLE